jgi:N utilization substance protein B
LIYELDLRPDLDSDEAIDMYPWDEEEADVVEYARFLVSASIKHTEEIDSMLREYIVGWRTERMVAVDRASIKLALCEGLIERRVPIAVAVSEAVELTKMFGTVESSRFVNGVLGRIIRALDATSVEEPSNDKNHIGEKT